MDSINPDVLGHWFDSYGTELVLYGRQWLDAAQAEDIVQEAFIRLFRQPQPPENPKAWLYSTVRNEAISQLRRESRRQHYSPKVEMLQMDWFEPETEEPLDAKTAQAGLSSLEQEQREIVVLRIWGQMTLKEIGALMGLPVTTIFNKYQSALQTLRRKLEVTCHTKMN